MCMQDIAIADGYDVNSFPQTLVGAGIGKRLFGPDSGRMTLVVGFNQDQSVPGINDSVVVFAGEAVTGIIIAVLTMGTPMQVIRYQDYGPVMRLAISVRPDTKNSDLSLVWGTSIFQTKSKSDILAASR